MKAILCTQYGPPENLEIKETPTPIPGNNEVLVKVYASAINDYDWGMVRGIPYLYRLLFGIMKPKHPIPGMELSGVVEALGKGVSLLKIDDAVYGDLSEYGFGSFAEYVAINEKALILKPEAMSFEEASAIPHAALLAYQGLVEKGKIQKGQKILINGAGGGVGTFALQLAKLYAAEVTGVDTGEKLKTMAALGFDHIIDYKKIDFTQQAMQYDLILDAKTMKAPWAYLKVLKPKGNYVTVGGHIGRLLQLVFMKPILSLFASKRVHLLALQPNKGLTYINQLYEEGKLKPVVDGPYALEDFPRLLQYFGEGKHKGKVIIKMV